MSLLDPDVDIKPIFVGHVYDAKFSISSWNNKLPNIDPGNGRWVSPNLKVLSGLLGHRKSQEEYVIQFGRYITAAWLTCYVGADNDVYVPDDRFNKIIRMVNKVYGLPMGTLDVEFTVNPGLLRIWFAKCYTGIINSRLTEPDIYRGVGKDWEKTTSVDHGYYVVKPQAIKTHLLAVERLLKYDVESNILVW